MANTIKNKIITKLVVEKSGSELWGSVKVKGNLIYDVANSMTSLQKKLKTAVLEIENVEIEDFDVSYDLTSFFEQHSYLKITDIAKYAEINQALMRQYAAGVKYPSEDRVKQIEKAIRQIGRDLTKVKLHKSQNANA